MSNRFSAIILALSVAFFGVAPQVLADPIRNPPLVCAAKASCSSCPTKDGCACGCILVTLDLGSTTVWTGQTPVYLRIHSSDESASLSTPAQLKVVMGWSFKAIGGGTTAGGAPQIVRFVQPEGAELVVHFQDGDSVGVPEPNNLGKSLARVQMVDAEGWATTSAPAFYDLYPGDGSVWRFLATGNTNERGALVSFTDPRGRVLTPDDFGVDIVRDALGNIRQVKTLTRLADVRTLSPTHYSVTVYPLTEEPEQVADTGLYALPEHAPTRVLDVAQGESVKELLVGFQKGTGDMRQYRYVAVNGDWTLYQPSGLVEAQELYFTEDESGAQRLHTIRDETGKLWSRDEYNYVSAYWGYLITNRIEGIPGDATRTTSWSYYTDGPHKDLLRETVEPTGNRILYEYDAQNRVIRESMPLVEEETLYSYEPVDPSDPPLLCDTRPRCVVRKMQGIEIQRTYYVYGTNGVDIVERVGEQGAAYGGTNVLRTVTTYYPATGAVTDGLVQSVRHEDGTIDNYAYDLTDGVWTETITHVHEQAPDIVPMRTTRSVRVRNALGQLVDSRTDLCTIGVEDLVPQADWTPIERLQYAYDVDGNEIRREDLAGRLWTAEWAGNCCGKVSETDWQGITTTYAYDDEGRVVVENSSRQNPIEFYHVRDLLGRETMYFVTNRSSSVGEPPTSYSYDSLGRPIRKTTSVGTTTYFYPSENERIEVDRFAVSRKTTFDSKGRLLRFEEIDEPAVVVSQKVDKTGYVTITTRLEQDSGFVFLKEIERDMFGRQVSQIQPVTNGMNVVKCLAYDEYGNLREISMEESPFLRFEVHPWDGTFTRISIVGDEWRRSKQSTSFCVKDGCIWRLFTDCLDCSDGEIAPLTVSKLQQLTRLPPGIVEENVTVDIRGNETIEAIEVDRPNAVVLASRLYPHSVFPETERFESGRLVFVADTVGTTNRFEYDALDRIRQIKSSPEKNTIYTYDERGLLAALSDGVATKRFVFDDVGMIEKIVRKDGTEIEFQRDSRGRVVFVSGDTYPFEIEYGPGENIKKLTLFPNGTNSVQTYCWEYDVSSGRLVTEIRPDGSGYRYEYSRSGARKSRLRLAEYLSDMAEYDEWGQLAFDGYSWFFRDGLGRIIREIHTDDGIHFVTNTYCRNAFGEVTNEVQSAGTLSREYDELGRVCSLTATGLPPDTWKFRVSYERDSFGRISRIKQDDFRLELAYESGRTDFTSVQCESVNVRRQYDASSDAIMSISAEIDGTVIYSDCSERNILGKIIERSRFFLNRASVWQYGYNSRGELSAAKSEALDYLFEYDGSGNRTKSKMNQQLWEYELNSNNRYWTIWKDGKLVPVFYSVDKVSSIGSEMNFCWTQDLMALSANLVHRMEYEHDVRGRIVRMSGYTGQSNSLSRDWLWDGNRLMLTRETSASETNITFYTWSSPEGEAYGGAEEAHLVSATQKGHLFIAIPDLSGSVIGYCSTNGTFSASCEFGPFGDLISESNMSRFDIWFAEKPYLPETSLSAFPCRLYSGELGRWISPDPLGVFGGVNLYSFALNDPVNNWDPIGLSAVPGDTPSPPTSKCPCSNPDIFAELEKKLREAAKQTTANRITKSTIIGNKIVSDIVSYEFAPEFAGWICCNPQTGIVSSTGPYKGSWRVEQPSPGSSQPDYFFTEDPWTYAFRNIKVIPTTENITDATNSTNDKRMDVSACPAGTKPLVFYHSHPKGEDFSKGDKGFADRKRKCISVYVDGKDHYKVYCHGMGEKNFPLSPEDNQEDSTGSQGEQ